MTDEGVAVVASNLRVERVSIDYQFRLLLGDEWELVIEQPFLLSIEGQEVWITPDDLGSVAPGIQLLHKEVAEARIDMRSGGLVTSFLDGAAIVVASDERFEAWSLLNSSGEMFIAQPGGGVAHFPGR